MMAASFATQTKARQPPLPQLNRVLHMEVPLKPWKHQNPQSPQHLLSTGASLATGVKNVVCSTAHMGFVLDSDAVLQAD